MKCTPPGFHRSMLRHTPPYAAIRHRGYPMSRFWLTLIYAMLRSRSRSKARSQVRPQDGVPLSLSLRSLIAALGLLGLLVTPARAAAAQAPDPQQLFQQAAEAQQRGDLAEAVRKYQQLIRLHPEIVAARANLGTALVALGRFDEAIVQYRAALAQAPGNRDLRLNLGLAYYKQGDFARAAGEFGPIHDAEPGEVRVATLLGDCEVRLERYDDVISLVTPLEPANPDNLALEWLLGFSLIRLGRAQEGLERVKKVTADGRSAEAFMLAAEAYLKLGQYEEAHRNVDAATRLDPHLAGLQTVTGMVLEFGGDTKGAAAAFQKALEANPDDFEAQVRLGSILYTDRDLDAAAPHLRRALEIRSNSSLARYQWARLESARGKVEDAVRDLEQVERQDPEWLEPHVDLVALYFRLKRPADGARERKIVDQIRADDQQRQSKSRIISPIP